MSSSLNSQCKKLVNLYQETIKKNDQKQKKYNKR